MSVSNIIPHLSEKGYSCLSEKTYRRHFLKSFNFPQFNQYFMKEALNREHTVIAVIDCFF